MSAPPTIVAVSRPPGPATCGLVRTSGPASRQLLADLLAPGAPAVQPDRHLTATRLQLDHDLVLPGRAAFLPGPSTYTGEDTAEIWTVGQPAVLGRLVSRLVELGARPAEAGEFSFRAFSNGRLDLTAAEGVAATIEAESDAQLAAAGRLRRGELGAAASATVNRLADTLARLEAGIDFTDQEDVTTIETETVRHQLNLAREELTALLTHSRRWTDLTGLPQVVLAGAPSTGKSTLYNALLGRERSVVDPTAHTTRDIIVEPLTLDVPDDDSRLTCRLVDLAGLAQAPSEIDRQVQDAARQAVADADILVVVHDGRHPGHAFVDAALKATNARTVIRLHTCADLEPTHPLPFEPDLAVSAQTGRGLDALRERLASELAILNRTGSDEAIALQPRHVKALGTALASLDHTDQLLGTDPEATELLAAELRQAIDTLAGLGGATTPDDLLGRIFSRFCI
ncbi:MAG: GTPase, partial [Phycisphaeraceae bacterium]|nr:GTPase [Phycisphaeraceae bacterium]